MIPVILSGGSGTRLWPVSRASYPKQFCEFYDRSFLNNTVHRLKPLGAVHILATKNMDSLTHRAAKQEGLPKQNVILEPMGKNTAPAMALLCHLLELRGSANEVVGVFPSDHLIADEEAFMQSVKLAEKVAQQGMIVTLGVVPNSPATGYGYIEVGPDKIQAEGALSAFKTLGFREKPNRETAQTYLNSGKHFWNAGIFVFKVSDMIAHFKKFQPAMWNKIAQIDAEMSNAEYNYAMLENISFDYAIMEKPVPQACVPCDMGWSDVGSWDEVARLAGESTSLPTRSRAQIFTENSENNYVYSVHQKVVGLIDVDDVIVVDTPDALLVCRQGSTQKVKDLVQSLKEAKLPEATEHPFEMRPWGGFEILADGRDFKTKRITMDPGGRLSYQSHQHRTEHWTVISGRAEVTLNDEKIILGPGQSIGIPVGAKHRMHNPGNVPLVFVEVQTGTYFGEDDIKRFQDDYNRAGQQP